VIRLETPRLLLRNWQERDRDLFFEINSDERVMEFYPYRRTRDEADAVFDEWKTEIETFSLGKFPVELKESGECMGYCGLVHANAAPALPADAVEIGWRFSARFWGNGYASEGARELLRYGFEDRRLEEIISFTIPINLRSQAVMERIGMTRDFHGDFDLPRIRDDKPAFKRHVLYRLTKADWQRAGRAPA
jgi:RimJ/RimL family protein N-acetyltransferase